MSEHPDTPPPCTCACHQHLHRVQVRLDALERLESKMDGLQRLITENLPLLQVLHADEELSARVAREKQKTHGQIARLMPELRAAVAEYERDQQAKGR